MLRRNFFATLLAPIVARFAPKVVVQKPRSLGPTVPFEFRIKPGSLDDMVRIQTELTEIMIQTIYTPDRRIKILGPDGVTLADFENPYEGIPFVFFSQHDYPWVKDA